MQTKSLISSADFIKTDINKQNKQATERRGMMRVII